MLGVAARLLIAAQARDDTRGPAAATHPRVRARRIRSSSPSGSRRKAGSRKRRTRSITACCSRWRGSERLRLDPSKTSGDYARELRARGSASYQPFRAFARRFDVAVFGHGGCDARLIDDLRALAQPLTARARAA